MAATGRFANRATWSIVAIVALVALGTALAKWFGPNNRGRTAPARTGSNPIADAEAAYRKGDWKRVADLMRPLLRSSGDNASVLRLYARASARLERDGAASAIYRDRLGTARLETEDYFLIGLGLVRAGKLDEALDVWTKALRGWPDHPELLHHFSRLSARQRRLDEAAQAADKLAHQPGWEARGLLLLGEIKELLDDPKGASDAVSAGLARDPDAKAALPPLAHYRRLLARSLLRLGRPGDAIKPLEDVRTSTNQANVDPETNWLLSRAYLQVGRMPDAEASLRSAGSYRDENPLVPEPALYVGAARCAVCHPGESRAHERTRHARTFHHGASLLALPLPDHRIADPDNANVSHTYERENEHIRVETRAGDRIFKMIVDYAFGVRDRYTTMIGRDTEKTYRASRLSSYHTADGWAWGRTSGDVSDSNSPESIRGQPIHVRDGVVRCLYCHVTQSREFRDPPPEVGPGPEAADSGIGCERCHGPGGNHVAAVKSRFPDRAIVNVGTTSASTIVAQCSDCHVVGLASEIRAAPEDPKFVRSTGLTLTLSRCYTESGGGMSCLTCHDPHRDDEKPPSFFESKCLECHAAKMPAQRSCRVNPSKDCLNCHMPKVPVAALHTDLTDHYIRIHKEK
jgi:tetratricopeptide (TPR) repeat protein